MFLVVLYDVDVVKRKSMAYSGSCVKILDWYCLFQATMEIPNNFIKA